MKMIRQSPESLVLLYRPWVLCAALAAGGALMLGLGLWNVADASWGKAGVAFLAGAALIGPALWFGTEKVDVVFTATDGLCTIKTRRLSGGFEEVYKLEQIEHAVLQTHKGPSETAGAHRIALVLVPGRPEDQRPLTNGYSGGRRAGDLVARINNWLETLRADTHA